MSRVYTHGKRLLSLILTLALLPCANLGLVTQARAAQRTESVTVAELVAENYELTDSEKKLLKSGELSSSEHEFEQPTDSSELISVDKDTKTVTAKNYTDSANNSWKPVSVELYAENALKETLTLTGEGNSKTATYTYAGNAFSVKVKYELYFTVDEDAQKALVSAIAGLKNGVENLDALAAVKADLSVLEQDLAKEQMMKLRDGSYISELKFGNAAAEAVTDLYEQYDKNGKFNLTAKLDAYAGDSKTKYLVNFGADFYAALKETYTHIQAIKEDGVWNSIEGVYATYYKEDGSLTSTGEMVNRYNPTMVESVKNAKVAKNALLSNLTAWLDIAEDTLTIDDWSAAGNTALVSDNVKYSALDKLVEALPGKLTEITTFSTSLKAADTTVQYNMSMYNVNVTVQLMVADEKPEKLVRADNYVKTVTLSEGAAKTDIQAAIDQIVKAAKAEWTSYEAEHYAEPVYSTALPETLTQDIDDLTITYNPKQYTVTYSGDEYSGSNTFYYGYQLTLPKHSDSARAYDYTIGGESYAQGATYKITGPVTISRKAGKAYNTTTFYKAVADSCGLSDKEKAILTSGALKGDATLNVRYPDANSGLVTISGGTLTAQTCASDYKGLVWAPYSYRLDSGDVQYFDTGYTVDLGNASYDSVTVLYRLTLTNFDAETVGVAANLPKTLVDETTAQKAAFTTLNSASDAMSQINGGMLSGLSGVIDGCCEAENITKLQADSLKTIVGNIRSNSVDTVKNELKLYTMLKEYNTDGLSYYYQNSKAVLEEIKALNGYLTELLEDRGALVALLTYADYGNYVNKIDTIQSTLNLVQQNLKAPNAAIDTTSDKLAVLVAALNGEGETATHTAQTAYLTSAPIVVAAASKIVVTVTVTDGATSRNVSETVNRGSAMTDAQRSSLKADVNSAVSELLGKDAKYYTSDYTETALDAELAGKLDSDKNLTYTWTPKQYTVNFVDASGSAVGKAATVTVKNMTITLPKTSNDNTQYVYKINGADTSAASYTFTKYDLDSLFTNGSYTITRTVKNLSADKLDQFVAAINGTNGAVEAELNNDRDTLTVTIQTNESGLSSDLTKFAEGLVLGKYNYVGLNGNGFVSTDSEGKLTVSIQALIDALELDSTSIQSLIDAEGKISGNLLVTKLQLGKDASGKCEQELKLVLKLNGKAPESLVALRSWDWADFELEGGTMSVHLQLPEKVYEIYLAALLLTGTDLNDINDLDAKIAYQFLWDLSRPAGGEGVSATTYKNTLDKLGIDDKGYLTEYETYVNKVLAYLNRYDVLQFSEDGYSMHLVAKANRINQILGKLITDETKLNTVKNMIVECQAGGEVKIALTADIKNLENTKFEALVFDRGALSESGIQNKANAVDFTKALASRLADVKAACGVILLSDVKADLTFNTNTYLDLNGYKITGNVTVKNGAKLTIIDSSLATDSGAGIDGTLTGSFNILAGKYVNGTSVTDVTSYLKNGYKQDKNGLVSNGFYSMEEDKDGNLTIYLNADLLDDDTTLNAQLVKALALDVCGDVFLNYYATAMLNVDEKTIFDFDSFDLVKLWSDTNTKDALITKLVDVIGEEGTAAFANKLIGALTDFEAIAEAIENDKSLLTFKMTTAPWQVKLVHNINEDYLDVELGSNKSADMQKTMKVDVKLAGSSANKTKVKNQAEKLSVVTVDAGIDSADGKTTFDVSYAAQTVKATGSAHADITIALSDDPNYAVVMGIIMAYTSNRDTVKNEFVEAVKSYYANNNTKALKAAFDKLTAGDVFKALADLNYQDDSKTMAAMIESLGLSGTVSAAAEALGKKYYRMLDGIGWALDIALDALGKTGSSVGMAGLSANAGTYGTYLADKNDVTRTVEKTLGGYTFRCEMKASSVSVKLELFKENNGVTVSGKVTSYGTAQSGVTVTLTDSRENTNTATTGSDGKYEFTGITAGTYTLTVTKSGCAKWTDTITVESIDVTKDICIYLRGDVNFDGEVDIADMERLYTHLNRTALLSDTSAADVNEDGVIDVADMERLYAHLNKTAIFN